ncbi:hypothetical protein TrST_g613 [Triparma strigata]|uniref:PH domain-containing protein n=1 Tax=Triparma strigata TaxID=1606541 RepID=A0A9W7B359_9STRA|nr:hypothetical protein TrST_g613 [Triparma strigata]
MLETVVFIILRSLLGHFIDLSRSQLNLNIWSGSFTFTDLFIRPSLLQSLGLPVTLFEGKVGALSITIPWRGLWKEKVKIVLNDVVVLGESNEFPQNRAKKASPSKPAKGSEDEKNADQNIVDSQTTNSKPTAGYLTKLLSTILHNAHVEINDVTVQYVTPGVSKPPHKRMPCSVSLSISSVSFVTNGEGWEGEAWYDPYGESPDAEPCYTTPFYKTCCIKGIKGSITDHSEENFGKSELFDVDVGLKLKVGSFNDGEPCVNDDGTDRTGVEVVMRDDNSPVPLKGLFGGRNVSVDVSLSSKGWGGEANKPGMLDGLLGKKPEREIEKSADGICVDVCAKDVEMLWGAAEEFRLAKQRAVARRRMEQAVDADAESMANASPPPIPNHKLDLKDIDAVDEVLKGVPEHLLPPRIGEEIKGERKRSMLLQQQEMQQLQQNRPRIDSNSDNEEEVWADAEEGMVTPPTPMFLPVTKRTNSDPSPSTQQSPSTPQTPPSEDGGWWGKVRGAFMSDKKPASPPDSSGGTPANPFLQPPMPPPSSGSSPSPSPRPSISTSSTGYSPSKRTDFHGIINFRLSLPGLQVTLNPSPSSSTLKRPVQLAVFDVLLHARMRKCPEAWLPDIIDQNSEAISQFYFASLFITDAAAIEKGTGLSTLPVLVDVGTPGSESSSKALRARFERSSVSGRGSSTVIHAKLVPLSVVLDYDLIRRAQRFFIPPTAPISISMKPAKIGNLIKKEREMQEMKYGNKMNTTNEASSAGDGESSRPALHLMSLDLDVGLIKVILPIDREIPSCPVLKLELQTHAQHSNPANERHRLEELRKKSLRKHTFTFNVTALNASWATPTQTKLNQGLKKLSAKSFVLENEEHMLLWDLEKTPIKVELKVKSIAGKQEVPRSRSPQSSPRAERSSGSGRKKTSSIGKREVLPEAFDIPGPAVALDDSSLWLDYDSIDDASLAPISINITIPELTIRLSTDLLMQVTWLVGYMLLQHSDKKESKIVTPSLSLTAFTLIMEENVHQLHLNATVPKISLEVITPSVTPKKSKDWFANWKSTCAARGEKLGQTYGPEMNAYTQPFNFPLPPSTPILVVRATGIEAKKQSATYASQLDIYLDQLSVSMHNYGVPTKKSKPEDNSFHTEGCGLFNVLQINQKVPSSDFARSNLSARRLIRIVKHPVGCHWIQDGGISTPTGIGKQTLTVHVQAVDLKISSEPLLFGRALHLISASKKAMALGAKVKEEVWGNVMIENAFWTAMAAAAMPETTIPNPTNAKAAKSSSSLDPSLTLNIATGFVQIKSYWGKDPVDVLSFDSSTTCMQKFDKMAASSAPLTLLGSIENLKLRDLTDYGRQAYKEIIAPCADNLEGGVTAEWTFSAASVNRTSPPTFGIRLKGMQFIYAQRKVMENFFYWQKWFCGHFQILSAKPEDVLAGSVITKIAAAKNYTFVQGCDSKPFRPDKHPGWRAHKTYQYEQGTEKEKIAQEAKIEILAVDSEIWLLHDSKHFDAIKIKFPTFKMWKAVSSEENYYSSPLLDQHKFAHEIPSMNRTARVRGKRVMSFSDLSEFGIRKKRLSEQSVDIDMEDIFADVENAQNDRKGELNAFLNEQIHKLRLKEKDLKEECDRLEDEYAKEDSVLEQLKLDQDSSMLTANEDEALNRPQNFARDPNQREVLPQFQSDATAKEFISQMAKVEHLDRKHSEALERLSQTMAEINALHEEIDWLTSSKQANSNLPEAPEGRFDMELVDCTLSTILSPNPIQHHLTVKAWLALGKPLDPWGNALYSDVYQTLGVLWDDRDFDVGVVKTPMDITVMLPRISWTLTQAQYAVILGLIMDNFGEDQTHVPNPNPETFDPVFDETVVGKTVFDDLGVQVSVPVYFEAAKIVVTEDEEAYFENLDNAMAEEGGLGGFGLGFSGRSNMGNESRTTSKSSDVGGLDWSNHDSTGSLTAAALRAEEEKRRIARGGEVDDDDQVGLQLESPDKMKKRKKDGQSPFGRLSDSESSGIDSDEDEYDVGARTRRKIRGRSNTDDEQLVKTGIFKKNRKSPGLGGKRNTNHLQEEESDSDDNSSSISDSDYSLTSTESDEDSPTSSLESDSSEQKRTAYPIFVIHAEQLFLGIDKNKEAQGVYLEVTSKSLSLHDVATGNTIGGHEVIGPSNEVKNQQRHRLNTLDHKFRGRLSTLNTHTEEDYPGYDENSMTDEGSIRSDNNYNSPPLSAPTSDGEDDDFDKEEEYLQLRYTQHNYGPAYRRVGVYVDQTVLTCYGDAIKRLIAFFYDPVKAHGEEEIQLRRLEGLPDFEEDEKNWDIDVQVTNTQVCLLEQLYESESRALVLNADFGYFHRWRGYPNHGTKGSGSIDMVMELLCRSMFFANQGNLRPSDAISLISPFRLKLDIQSLLPCLSVGLGGTPSEAAVIKKTVLLWTERADHSSELSELDALHGDVEKAEFGTPGMQTTSGLVAGGGGDRFDVSTLIDLGLSLPDIKLMAVVIKALITDLKRSNSSSTEDDELESTQHSATDVDDDKSAVSFSSPARKSSSRSTSGSKPNLLSPSVIGTKSPGSETPNSEKRLSPSSSFNNFNNMPTTPFKSSPGQLKQPLAPQTSFAGVLTNMQVLIGLSPTRISFINNVMGIPLCSVLLSDMNVTMSRVPRLEGLRVYGTVSLGGSYFNHLAHRWDPLVETTTLEVDVAKELKSQKTKAKVALKDPVNINLTHALLRLCAHDSLLTDHVTSSSKSLSPYLILNRCGERCVCYFRRSDATVVEVGVNDDNNGLPLDFRTIRGQTRRSSLVEGLSNSSSKRKSRKMQLQGVQTHTLGVSVTISGWVFESANSVPMDVAGIHTIRLQAMAFREEAEGRGRARGRGVFDQDGGFDGGVNFDTAQARSQKRSSSGGGGKPPAPPLLVAEVTLKSDGSKQITIRSRVAIRNTTGMPTFVRLSHKESTSGSSIMRRFSLSNGRQEIVKKLIGGEVLYVPISLVKPSTGIWVRPSEKFEWSPVVDWLSDLEVQDNVISMSTPKSGVQHENEGIDQVSSNKWSCQMEVSRMLWHSESDRGVLGDMEDEEAEWEMQDDADEDEDDRARSRGDSAPATIGAGGKRRNSKKGGLFSFDSMFSFNKSSSSANSGPKDENESGNDMTAADETTLVADHQKVSVTSVEKDSELVADNRPALLFVRPSTNNGHKLASVVRKGDSLVLHVHANDGGSSHRIIKKGQDAFDSLHDDFYSKMPSLMPSSLANSNDKSKRQASPLLTLSLLPPMVLHNLLCMPLLYRVTDRLGAVAAEGVIPIGTSLPLFRLDLRKKLYLSVRVVNYGWSEFSKLHTPRCVHPHVPKRYSVEMRGGKLKKPSGNGFVEMDIPTLKLKTMVHGRHVRIYSRVWIVNHTDLTLQYRESSAAAGVDAPSFLRSSMPILTHKSLGAIGNTSADVERYVAHAVRDSYGFGPDDYDDEKIEWADSAKRGQRKEVDSTKEKTSFFGSKRRSSGGGSANKDIVGGGGAAEIVKSSQQESTSLSSSAGGIFGGVFGGGRDRNVSDPASEISVETTGNPKLGLDEALDGLDEFGFDAELPPPNNPPFMMRKRTTSVGGEDSASVVSEDSGFGSVDHRTEELLDRVNKYRSSPTMSGSMSELSERTSQRSSQQMMERRRASSMEERLKRKSILLSRETSIALQKKLEARMDRTALEKRKILHKRRVINGITIRLPTNHLNRVTIDGSHSDDSLHDLFHQASLVGGLRCVWVPESDGGIGFMFGGYAPLSMSTQLGTLELLDLRLCHRIELHVAWQQLDLNNTGKGNVKLPRYIDWGEAIMFSPPSTLGMRFHLCTRVLDSEWSSPFDANGQKEVVSGLTSCLTLKQLKLKKRVRNIQLAGGWGDDLSASTPPLTGLGGRAAVRRTLQANRAGGGLARLAEEGEGGGRDSFNSLSGLVGTGTLDEDTESDSDGEDSDEGEHNWGAPLSSGSPGKESAGKKKVQQKRTTVYKPAAVSGDKKSKNPSERRCQYDIGVHCASGKDVYFRTTVITFLPRYVLVNDLRVPIEITQFNCEEDWRMSVPGGTSTGFHWPFKDKAFLMSCRLLSDGFKSPSWTWSGEFSIDTLGEVALKVRQKFRRSEIFLIRVVVKIIDASIVVLFEQVDEFVPYRIDNETSHRIRFRQGISDESKNSFDYMMPRSSMPYSWDFPMGHKSLQIEFQQRSKWVTREYKLDALHDHSRVKLTRSLPNLSDPEFEGFLERRQGGVLEAAGKWARVYCVLKASTMYIFRPPKTGEKSGMLNRKKTERLDLLGVLTVGPGAQFSLMKGGLGNKGNSNNNNSNLNLSKNQIKQCETVQRSWSSKFTTELQKMAESAIAVNGGVGGGGGGIFASGGDSGVSAAAAARKREEERSTTIAVLLQRYLKDEGRKGGYFKARIIDDVQPSSNISPLTGPASFGSGSGGGMGGLNGSGPGTPSQSNRKNMQRRSSLLSTSGRRASLHNLGGSEAGFGAKPTSRFFMNGSDWIGLIIKLGICGNRGKALSCCNDLMQRGYLALSDTVSGGADGGSSADGSGTPGPAGRRGKRMSLQLSSHTPRRLRLESNMSSGAQSRGSKSKRSISPKRDGSGAGMGGSSVSGSERSAGGGKGSKGRRSTTVNTSSAFFPSSGNMGGDSDAASKSKKGTLLIDFFQDSATVTYVLLAPTRDEDINLGGSSQFEVATVTGNTHRWRAKIPSQMKQWVVALRNAADNAALSILTFKPENEGLAIPDQVQRSESKDALSSLLKKTGVGGMSNLGSNEKGFNEEVTLDVLLAKTYVKVKVKADGPTKVLELSEEGGGADDGLDVNDEVEGASRAGMMKKGFSQRSLTQVFGSKGDKGSQPDSDEMTKMRFEGELMFSLGVSVIDKARESTSHRPRELVFLTMGDVKAITRKSLISTEMSLTVEKLQIDNQLHDCYNPTIVKARPLSRKKVLKVTKNAGGGGEDGDSDGEGQLLHIPGLEPRPLDRPPAMHFFASRSFVDAKSVLFWDVVTLWLHPLDVKLEERLLFQALKLKDAVRVKSIGGTRVLALTEKKEKGDEMKHGAFAMSYNSTISGGSQHLVRGKMDTSEAVAYGRKRKVFVNFLHLHPVDISLSFKGGGVRNRKGELGGVGEMAISAIGGLDDTRLKLGALQINNAFGSKSDLVDRIVKHYIFASMKQVHVLGNVEFLGNPVGLVNNLGTGVRDFFYEPIDGLTQGGKLQPFLEGLKRGTTSLGSNFGEGAFNTMSKMTGALGEGIAHISFDEDYQANRSAGRLREAKTASQGLRRGIFEFGESLGDAVGGVVMQPIRGMEKEGGIGFVKGIAKGVVGVPVKKVVGVLDLASRATEGVKNEAKNMRADVVQGSKGDEKEGRIRHPRSFGKRGELIEYDAHSARKQKVLARVAGGKYANEHVSLDWLVKTLQAPVRKNTVFSGNDYDLEKMVAAAMVDEEERVKRGGGVSGASGFFTGDVFDDEGAGNGSDNDEENFSFEYSERYIILTNKRLMYLSEDRGTTSVQVKELREDGEESGGSTADLQELLTQSKPKIIWIVPPSSITKLRIERNGIRVMLNEAVRYNGGPSEKRFEVLQDLVPTVHDLKSQEVLVFSSVCEKTLGVSLAACQHLYPPARNVVVEGALQRSKALLGSVTETYYYCLCGNVLYEYASLDKASHRTLRMVVPLSNVTIMLNPGRDIVLKPIPPAVSIAVATRSTKFHLSAAINKLGSRIDKFKDHLKADDDDVDDDDDVGGGGDGKKPLLASSRDEIVLQPADRGCGATLEEWYKGIREAIVIGNEDRSVATTSLFIECNGLSRREMSSLSSSLVGELNAQRFGDEEYEGFGIVDLELLSG